MTAYKIVFPPTVAEGCIDPRKSLAEKRSAFNKLLNDTVAKRDQSLREKAAMLDVGITHVFSQLDRKGGLTIAFRKTSVYTSGTMVEVAVATCSKEDSFSRKIGTTLALEKFFDGDVIQLPLAIKYSDDLAGDVKRAFNALYCSIY